MVVGDAQSVVSSDGTRIAFTPSGSGEPLLAVHGSAADASRWAGVATQLGSHFTVYAIDRRGRGGSGDAVDYAIEREVDDITAVVRAIGAPLVLLGHSYGAICALEASLRVEGVSCLILYEPPLPVGIEIYNPGQLDRLQALEQAGDREALLSTFLAEVVHATPDQLQLMRTLPVWQARLAAAPTLVRESRALERYVFTPERWAGFDTPTLLLMGSDSAPF